MLHINWKNPATQNLVYLQSPLLHGILSVWDPAQSIPAVPPLQVRVRACWPGPHSVLQVPTFAQFVHDAKSLKLKKYHLCVWPTTSIKTPFFIERTHFCTTNLGIWYFFGPETYIHFVAQKTSIIRKLFTCFTFFIKKGRSIVDLDLFW